MCLELREVLKNSPELYTVAGHIAGGRLDRLDVAEEGVLILVRVEASHFLWKMVRRLVGVLVEVGRGALGPRDVRTFLEAPSETPARHTAPPSGLFLERVFYEGEARERPLRSALFLDEEGR